MPEGERRDKTRIESNAFHLREITQLLPIERKKLSYSVTLLTDGFHVYKTDNLTKHFKDLLFVLFFIFFVLYHPPIGLHSF